MAAVLIVQHHAGQVVQWALRVEQFGMIVIMLVLVHAGQDVKVDAKVNVLLDAKDAVAVLQLVIPIAIAVDQDVLDVVVLADLDVALLVGKAAKKDAILLVRILVEVFVAIIAVQQIVLVDVMEEPLAIHILKKNKGNAYKKHYPFSLFNFIC